MKREPLLFQAPDGSHTTEPKEKYHQHNADGEPLYLAPIKEDRERDILCTKSELLENYHCGRNWINTDNGRRHIDKYCEKDRNKRFVEANPILGPTRYSRAHINDRVEKTQALLDEIEEQIERLKGEADHLKTHITDHLWVDADFAETALAQIHSALKSSKDLKQRLEEIRDGFANLPCSDDDLEV